MDHNQRAVSTLFPNRLLVVNNDHIVTNTARSCVAPLAISQRDGRLVHCLGKTLWFGSTGEGPTAMERPGLSMDEDISATMMRRARCVNVLKYGLDTTANIELLSNEEMEYAREYCGEKKRESPPLTHEALLRLWTWIERIEEIGSQELDEFDDGHSFKWATGSLVDAGAWNLLQMDGPGETEMKSYSEELACDVYESPDRRYVAVYYSSLCCCIVSLLTHLLCCPTGLLWCLVAGLESKNFSVF